MENLYNKVIEKFESDEVKQLFNDGGLVAPIYIDLYAGQDLDEENFELFAQNALLIEWEVDHDAEPPEATVTFRCCYEQLRDTSNISANRELGLNFLKYVAKCDAVLSGLESETTGKMELIKENFNQMDSIVDIYILEYKCTYKGRKSPQGDYQEGYFDTVDVNGVLIQKYDFD